METIINFFTLRPAFTILGLKVAWYVYLLNVFVQLYVVIAGLSQAAAQRGFHLDLWSPASIPLVLGAVAQLILVRVLLEVAAVIIAGSQATKS